MKLLQPYFIHLRNHNEEGEVLPKGGFTIAWFMDEEGDICVGHPAICHKDDLYNKSIGRGIALDLLMNAEEYAFYIPCEYIIDEACHAALCQNDYIMIKSLYEEVKEAVFNRMIEEGVENTMSMHFFDNLVREGIQQHYSEEESCCDCCC